jgi:hypothetical protein
VWIFRPTSRSANGFEGFGDLADERIERGSTLAVHLDDLRGSVQERARLVVIDRIRRVDPVEPGAKLVGLLDSGRLQLIAQRVARSGLAVEAEAVERVDRPLSFLHQEHDR